MMSKAKVTIDLDEYNSLKEWQENISRGGIAIQHGYLEYYGKKDAIDKLNREIERDDNEWAKYYNEYENYKRAYRELKDAIDELKGMRVKTFKRWQKGKLEPFEVSDNDMYRILKH